MEMSNKQLLGWFLLGTGIIVIGVASYFNQMVVAITEDMAYGFATVVQKYQIKQIQNQSYDYRAQVILPENNTNAGNSEQHLSQPVYADVSKEEFNSLSEGSQLALAWQRSNPSQNLAGREVLPLVSGVITEAEFAQLQIQKGNFALYIGAAMLALGVLVLGFSRLGTKMV